ncbi:MAG: hypothetical protein ACTSYI_16535 [Promethearchaeota archaeon]
MTMNIPETYNRIYPKSNLFFIPSWGKLMGFPTLGTYKNRKIINITADPVVFLSSLEITTQMGGETKHYIFGIGYYYTKFQIDEGKYIIDFRRLTGLCISDFVYSYMLDSKDASLIQDPEVVLKETIYKVPLELNDNKRTENQISFLKGVISRELFVPNKEIFVEFTTNMQHDPAFNFKSSGHIVLMATRQNFNILFISKETEPSLKEKLLETTAGLTHATTGADFLLKKEFSPPEIELIESQISSLEKIYRNMRYNQTSPFEYFETGALQLRSIVLQKFTKGTTLSFSNKLDYHIAQILDRSDLRVGILATPLEYEESIPWDPNHPRKTLESWGISRDEHALRPMALTETQIKDQEIDLKDYKRGPTEQATDYKLENMKNPVAPSRDLPPMPQKSVKEILNYLQKIINDKYEMKSIGEAFGEARDITRKLAFHTDFVWEMSKIANAFEKSDLGLGLNPKDTEKTLLKIEEWLAAFERTEQEAKEALEKERLEKERVEKERFERQKQYQKAERERKEKMLLEKEREEKERLEKQKQSRKAEREREEKALLAKVHEQQEKEKILITKALELEDTIRRKSLAAQKSAEVEAKKGAVEVAASADGDVPLAKAMDPVELYEEFMGLIKYLKDLNVKLKKLHALIKPQKWSEKRARRKQRKDIKRRIKKLSKQTAILQKNMKKNN